MEKVDEEIFSKSIVTAWIEALKPSGKVLEIGFNRYSCCGAQAQSHVIIETNPEKIEAAKTHSATLIQERWQDALPKLGVFDLILFHDVVADAGMNKAQLETGNLIVQEGLRNLRSIENLLPNLSTFRYSDQDLKSLCQQVEKSHLKHLSRFLCDLRFNGQISQEQHERMIEEYHLDKGDVQKRSLSIGSDYLLDCLSQCIQKHMHTGSRFSCLLNSAASKYEDPCFFEQIIANPLVDYQEKLIKDEAICMVVCRM